MLFGWWLIYSAGDNQNADGDADDDDDDDDDHMMTLVVVEISAYDIFSFDVIPVLGQLVANDRASYQYLVERYRRHAFVRSFP